MFKLDTLVVPLRFGTHDVKRVKIKDSPESILWASIIDGDRALPINSPDKMAGTRSDVLHISMRRGESEIVIGPAQSMDKTRIHVTDEESAEVITVVPFVEE